MKLVINLSKDSSGELENARILITATLNTRIEPCYEKSDAPFELHDEATQEKIDSLIFPTRKSEDSAPTVIAENLQFEAGVHPIQEEPRETVVPSPPAAGQRLPDVPAPPVLLDSAGVAWNPEVHSESQSKVADGTWRKRRNTGAKNTTAESVPPGVTVVTPSPAAIYQNGEKVADGVPGDWVEGAYKFPPPSDVPPPPFPTAPVASAPVLPVETFIELMTRLAQYFKDKKMTTPDVIRICQKHGISSLQECSKRKELIVPVCIDLDARAAEVA